MITQYRVHRHRYIHIDESKIDPASPPINNYTISDMPTHHMPYVAAALAFPWHATVNGLSLMTLADADDPNTVYVIALRHGIEIATRTVTKLDPTQNP